MANLPEQLIVRPGMRTISPAECLQRMRSFINQCPGMTAVILIGQEGNPTFVRCTRTTNIDDTGARELLRMSIHQLDQKGGAAMAAPGGTLVKV